MSHLKFVLIVTLTVGGLAGEAVCAERKNLLIIETDEHHFKTLGCYGGTIVGTPNIDWIANNGAKCTSFYATTPSCSPSRAALVSGLYPQKTPVTANNIALDDSVITFAEILKRNGYQTGYAGKWHLDGEGKPQWEPRRKFGFDDNRFMFNRGHWKKFEDTPDGPRVAARTRNGEPSYKVAGADEKTFSTDWLCTKAINFIDKNADKPFCYVVNLPDPHGPNTVRAPYDTMYNDVEVPIPASLVRKPEQIPRWGQPTRVKPAQLKTLMRNYYGMVKCIDDNVGRIITTLRKKDLLEKTIIVFTSDHGDLCGEHGRLNKGVPYEGSARIPFVMYCNGKIKAGTVVNQALSNVDFLPTIMSLLDVEFEQKVDGRDATPLFTGADTKSWDDIAIVRSAGRPGRGGDAWLCAVTQQYKLVFATNEDPWLIDIANDPNELTNLFSNPTHKPQIKRMTEQLVAYAAANQDDYATYPGIRQWLAQITEGK